MSIKETNKETNNIEIISTYNIYTKLQKLRKDFHNADLKKSGENKYAGFKYLELHDFLPLTVSLLEKYNMTTIMSTSNEGASLVLINADNPTETITFFIPDAECELKSTTPIQSLGAKITYQKRYLYQQLTDASVPDVLDPLVGKDKPQAIPTVSYKLSDKQINRLLGKAKNAKKTEDDVKSIMKNKLNKNSYDELNKEEYERICTYLDNLASK